MISTELVVTFVGLFVLFIVLGFYAKNWRKGDLNNISEWALAGRKLGTTVAFFLVGADLYSAYTFVAVPSGIFVKGSLYFFALPYVVLTFGIAMITMPKFWTIAKAKGYVTASDFVRDRFSSKSLSIMVAVTGIVAMLPYIALQIVGMQAVLTVMLQGTGNSQLVTEIALIISFVILAAFTYTSGLRGATLTGIFKDVLIWITVIAIIVIVPISVGGFGTAFSNLTPNYVTLPENLIPAYTTLAFGSAIALYLYPHAINGILSTESASKLRKSTALLPLYGIGLSILALMGVLVYSVPSAMNLLSSFPESSRGILVIPSLILSTMPGWFAGVALLGIFIGGLVPAAIMAIAQANLLTRNVIKEFKPNLSPTSEVRITKWASTIFKFTALGFVFAVPASYSISLQLLGGIIIAQILPAILFGMYVKWLNKKSLIVGLIAGCGSGILIVEFVNNFGSPTNSLLNTPFGPIYTALVALAINLAIVFVGSAIRKIR